MFVGVVDFLLDAGRGRSVDGDDDVVFDDQDEAVSVDFRVFFLVRFEFLAVDEAVLDLVSGAFRLLATGPFHVPLDGVGRDGWNLHG